MLVVSFVAFLSSENCRAQYDTMKFGDFGVSSVTPMGAGAVKGAVWVEMENPQVGFWVSKVEGKLYRNGVALIEGHADDYYVPNGTSKLTLKGTATLCPGVSIFDVLGLILFDPTLYTVDIKAVITDDGAEPVIKEVKDIPILTLLKKNDNKIENNDESKNSK